MRRLAAPDRSPGLGRRCSRSRPFRRCVGPASSAPAGAGTGTGDGPPTLGEALALAQALRARPGRCAPRTDGAGRTAKKKSSKNDGCTCTDSPETRRPNVREASPSAVRRSYSSLLAYGRRGAGGRARACVRGAERRQPGGTRFRERVPQLLRVEADGGADAELRRRRGQRRRRRRRRRIVGGRGSRAPPAFPDDFEVRPWDRPTINALDEMEEAVGHCRRVGAGGLVVVAPPFHLTRGLLTALSVSAEVYPSLPIYAFPGHALPWGEAVAHSQGVLVGTRHEFLDSELDRMWAYHKKGDLMKPSEALAALKKRDLLCAQTNAATPE